MQRVKRSTGRLPMSSARLPKTEGAIPDTIKYEVIDQLTCSMETRNEFAIAVIAGKYINEEIVENTAAVEQAPSNSRF